MLAFEAESDFSSPFSLSGGIVVDFVFCVFM